MRVSSSVASSFRPMRSSKLPLAGLALIIAAGCAGKNRGAGFDEDQLSSDPNSGGSKPFGEGQFGGDVSKNLALDPLNATVIIDTAANPIVAGSVTYKVL